jgi:hypothetical protein
MNVEGSFFLTFALDFSLFSIVLFQGSKETLLAFLSPHLIRDLCSMVLEYLAGNSPLTSVHHG